MYPIHQHTCSSMGRKEMIEPARRPALASSRHPAREEVTHLLASFSIAKTKIRVTWIATPAGRALRWSFDIPAQQVPELAVDLFKVCREVTEAFASAILHRSKI